MLRDKKPVGQRVAIIGAGGIGFDTAEYLVHKGVSSSLSTQAFSHEWGIDQSLRHRGGLAPQGPQPEPAAREIVLLNANHQSRRRTGENHGLIHRASLLTVA